MWNKSFFNKHYWIGSFWPAGLIHTVRGIVWKSKFKNVAEFNAGFNIAEFNSSFDNVAEFNSGFNVGEFESGFNNTAEFSARFKNV